MSNTDAELFAAISRGIVAGELSYFPGAVVTYTTFTGGTRRVRITEWFDDVKNGRPGFDAVVLDGDDAGTSVWGYASQIVAS